MEKRKKGCPGSNLGEEIIFQEILPRLPVKSIFRFKSVCKKWRKLFTHDPLFRAHHHSHQSKVASLMFCAKLGLFISSDDGDPCHQFKWSKPEFMSTPSSITYGSTNGLFYGACYSHEKIFIVNPLTNDTIYIPTPKRRLGVALASDPGHPNFGYTIVALSYENEYDDDELIKFQVYSSKTPKWRASKINNSEFRVPSYGLLREFQAVFTGGAKIYWSLVKDILWFDIDKDVAGVIECPDHHNLVFDDPDMHSFYTEIGVCDGELSYSKKTKKGEIEIWLLRDKSDGFEWVMKHKVSLQTILQENWDVMLKFLPNKTKKMEISNLILSKKRVSNPKKAAKFFTHPRYCHPMPYSGGDGMWFTINLDFFPKLFLFNLRTKELRMIRHDVFMKHPIFPFTPTLLPCPR